MVSFKKKEYGLGRRLTRIRTVRTGFNILAYRGIAGQSDNRWMQESLRLPRVAERAQYSGKLSYYSGSYQ